MPVHRQDVGDAFGMVAVVIDNEDAALHRGKPI